MNKNCECVFQCGGLAVIHYEQYLNTCTLIYLFMESWVILFAKIIYPFIIPTVVTRATDLSSARPGSPVRRGRVLFAGSWSVSVRRPPPFVGSLRWAAWRTAPPSSTDDFCWPRWPWRTCLRPVPRRSRPSCGPASPCWVSTSTIWRGK